MISEKVALDLQRQLAQVDTLTTPRRPPRGSGPQFMDLMVLKFQDLKIKMYQEGRHPRPHVHVDYGKQVHTASYAIDDGRRIAGILSSKYDEAIMRWITEQREVLLDAWNKVQSGQDAAVNLISLRGSKL